MKLGKLQAIYYLLWDCCIRGCLLKYTLLPEAIQRRKFSLTSWPKSQSLFFIIGALSILYLTIQLLFALAGRKLRAKLVSLLYPLCTCESFRRITEGSSSTLLDVVKLTVQGCHSYPHSHRRTQGSCFSLSSPTLSIITMFKYCQDEVFSISWNKEWYLILSLRCISPITRSIFSYMSWPWSQLI